MEAPNSLRSARILIVDDQRASRSRVAESLRSEGFFATVARSIAEMDRVLARGQTDLVIVDLRFPSEGLSICRRLAANHGPPVIMMSMAETETDRIVALEVGAAQCVAKACSPREVLANVHAVLRLSARLPRQPGAQVSAATASWAGVSTFLPRS